MKNESSAYKNIFKSTFLFGFVQVFNILAKVVLNKTAAIFLGTEGIGLIGIFQSISDILKTVFSLGVSRSSVRDIAKANEDGNEDKFSEIITVTHKIILFTSLLGLLFTLVFASYLSKWSFGDSTYTSLFLLLSAVVFFNILSDGQLGVLKGMRNMKELAKATVFGSFTALVFGIPFYCFLGNDGIVPTLLAMSISLVVFSSYYVRKIKYRRIVMPMKEIFAKSSNMIRMGIAFMFVTFMGMICDYVMKIYISNNSDLSILGVYQAGLMVVSGYFGIVITAMSTDYYPRISAVHDDNIKLSEEVNRQAKVGLILITPLIVTFMFLMPFFIQVLYANSFLMATEYMRYAIFWVLIITVSNPIDMILIVKQNTNLFMLATVIYRVIGIGISIYGFNTYGLRGLGIAMLIMGVIHFVLMQSIMYRTYNIFINSKTLKMFIVSILLVILSFFVSAIDNDFIKYILGVAVLGMSVFYSMRCFSEITDLSIFDFVKSKIKRKK